MELIFQCVNNTGEVLLPILDHFHRALCHKQWWNFSIRETFTDLDLKVSVFKTKNAHRPVQIEFNCALEFLGLDAG